MILELFLLLFILCIQESRKLLIAMDIFCVHKELFPARSASWLEACRRQNNRNSSDNTPYCSDVQTGRFIESTIANSAIWPECKPVLWNSSAIVIFCGRGQQIIFVMFFFKPTSCLPYTHRFLDKLHHLRIYFLVNTGLLHSIGTFFECHILPD